MKQFLKRYSHWFILILISFSFITMFINVPNAKLDMMAVVMGGIGFLSMVYLVFVVEQRIRKQSKEK